ncbi:glucooligosaccharide oxidase [Mycena olivaceomarginata]|nr:glucooligosaccharide oxidase [Mycena olivaceomarginata]
MLSSLSFLLLSPVLLSAATYIHPSVWTCASGNTNQLWTVSGNTIQWTSHSSCLDLTDGSVTNGNPIQIWACSGGPNQQWPTTTLTTSGISAAYPGDSTYSAAAKAYNLRYTLSPAAVAFPTSAAQVAAAVKAGVAQNMQVVARSGGHSYIANGLGGNNGALVVDLSNMKAISVRAANNTALIETGNRLGDIALALNAAGRAIPTGRAAMWGSVGIPGGFGFTSRAWGLTLDVIKSATVVLANGTIATASSTVNTDLFWAIRGASPSFGIVTSVEVQTFPAPASATVFQYGWDNMDITTASNAIASFQTFATTNIPPEFGAELGHISVGLTGAWYDSAHPSSSTISPGSYINSVAVLAGQPLNTASAPEQADTFYTKSLMTPSGSPMSSAAITAFVTYMANQGFTSDTAWFVEVELFGGSNSTINAVPLDSTAFAKRDTLFTFQLYASIVSNSPANWNYGAYLNYPDDRLTNAATLYYGSHYARLKSIKTAVDPLNVFRIPIGV